MTSVIDDFSQSPLSHAVCLPHSIAQNAIEWGTRKLYGPPALIYAVDFYAATALAQSTKPDALACKRKIIGDEQGPKVTLTRPWYDFGLGLVNEEAGPWDVISAITRYFK